MRNFCFYRYFGLHSAILLLKAFHLLKQKSTGSRSRALVVAVVSIASKAQQILEGSYSEILNMYKQDYVEQDYQIIVHTSHNECLVQDIT